MRTDVTIVTFIALFTSPSALKSDCNTPESTKKNVNPNMIWPYSIPSCVELPAPMRLSNGPMNGISIIGTMIDRIIDSSNV